MEELKNCPFCGTSDLLIKLHPKKPNGKDFEFVSHKDETSCVLKGISLPIEKWNTRTSSSSNGFAMDREKLFTIILSQTPLMPFEKNPTWSMQERDANRVKQANLTTDLIMDHCQEFKKTAYPTEIIEKLHAYNDSLSQEIIKLDKIIAEFKQTSGLEKLNYRSLWDFFFQNRVSGHIGERYIDCKELTELLCSKFGTPSLKCPKCDGAEINPEDLTACEVGNVLDRFAEQYGWIKVSPSVPSEELRKVCRILLKELEIIVHLPEEDDLKRFGHNWREDLIAKAIRNLLLNKEKNNGN